MENWWRRCASRIASARKTGAFLVHLSGGQMKASRPAAMLGTLGRHSLQQLGAFARPSCIFRRKKMNTEPRTEEERERIREAFRFSRPNLALEGFEPGPDIPLLEEAIINGRMTGDQVRELAKERALGRITEEAYMEALRG
jgi:hypothetical protein